MAGKQVIDNRVLNSNLEELLRQNRASTQNLPDLVQAESFFEPFWKLLRQLAGEIYSWLPNFSISPDNGDLLFNLLQMLLILLVCMAIVVLIVWIAKKLKPLAEFTLTGMPAAAEFRIDYLEQQINLALQRGDWAGAMRRRWRLFLKHSSRPAALTPLEYCRSCQEIDTQSIMAGYQAMFSGELTGRESFEFFSTQLSSLEKGAGAG